MIKNIFLVICSLIVFLVSLYILSEGIIFVMNSTSTTSTVISAKFLPTLPKRFLPRSKTTFLKIYFKDEKRNLQIAALYIDNYDLSLSEQDFKGKKIDIFYERSNPENVSTIRGTLFSLSVIGILLACSIIIFLLSLFKIRKSYIKHGK